MRCRFLCIPDCLFFFWYFNDWLCSTHTSYPDSFMCSVSCAKVLLLLSSSMPRVFKVDNTWIRVFLKGFKISDIDQLTSAFIFRSGVKKIGRQV